MKKKKNNKVNISNNNKKTYRQTHIVRNVFEYIWISNFWIFAYIFVDFWFVSFKDIT